MDEEMDTSIDAKELHKNMEEQLDQKINEWKDVIESLLKKRFDSTHNFVDRVTENLQKIVPADELAMPAEEFIEKHIEPPSIQDESVVNENIGNQTMAAIDQLNYIMNSSRHDDDAKEVASKLQTVLLTKKK